MMEIKWKAEYETGYDEVDKQHKLIFQKVNELFVACKAGASDAEAKEMSDFLVDYCSTHFLYEQNLMKAHNYPDYANHFKAHTSFKQFATDFAQKAGKESMNVSMVVKLNQELIKWLVEHIMVVDVKMAKYINEEMLHGR